jgi:thiol-disulfide isomerase/thioredoxin
MSTWRSAFWVALIDWRSHLKTLAVVVVVAWLANLWHAMGTAQGPAPSANAPLLSVNANEAANLQDWLAAHRGQVVMVHFWATWCPVCKASEDNTERLRQTTPGGRGWPMVSVAMQSGTGSEIERHLQRQGLAWPTVPDPAANVAKAWGVSAVPTTFLLSPQGQIVGVSAGYTSTLGLWARLMWAEWGW